VKPEEDIARVLFAKFPLIRKLEITSNIWRCNSYYVRIVLPWWSWAGIGLLHIWERNHIQEAIKEEFPGMAIEVLW
jgi:hypothetical protein